MDKHVSYMNETIEQLRRARYEAKLKGIDFTHPDFPMWDDVAKKFPTPHLDELFRE